MRAVLAATALLLAFAGPALACGVCAEDKVAATYDHQSVQQALARGQLVVYCEVAGLRDPNKVRAALTRLRGVDARSLRLSAEPAALSFVLDPRQQSAQAAVLALQAGLPQGVKVGILKVEGGARAH